MRGLSCAWLPAAAVMVTLAGCATAPMPGSVVGGECKAFERPPYAVKGQTQYDQDVADNFVETGVGACHWTRPAPRPPELEATPALQKPPVAKPVRKPGLVARINRRLRIKSAAQATPAPAAALPPAPEPVAAEPPPPAPAPPDPPKPKRPLTALEELLHLRPTDE